jgi:hypothetical protein
MDRSSSSSLQLDDSTNAFFKGAHGSMNTDSVRLNRHQSAIASHVTSDPLSSGEQEMPVRAGDPVHKAQQVVSDDG